MKRNIVLITNCGYDLSQPRANKRPKARSAENTFDILSLGLEDIDLAIVDLGANTPSLAIVEALTHTKPAPPVIALVDEKNGETIPEFHRRGAAACLKKPFCADELARLIEAVCVSPSDKEAPSSDK